jgi:hypothetical protein
MDFRVVDGDISLLRMLGDCRLLTPEQLAWLCDRNVAATRNRLRRCIEEQFVDELPMHMKAGRGRPSSVFSLGEPGLDLLLERDAVPADTKFDAVTGATILTQAKHQFLLNSVRVQMHKTIAQVPDLAYKFLSTNSPLVPWEYRKICLSNAHIEQPDAISGEASFLIPDAVCLATEQTAGKTLLFFIEVDTGSEPLSTGSPDAAAIDKKIMAYQECFRNHSYKQFEALAQSQLNGFRTLFVTPDIARSDSVCRTVRSTRPSDFVWVADLQALEEQSIGAAIWRRGGRVDSAPESILGQLTVTK